MSNPFFNAMGGGNLPGPMGTVSYTHLAVYKRQAITFGGDRILV